MVIYSPHLFPFLEFRERVSNPVSFFSTAVGKWFVLQLPERSKRSAPSGSWTLQLRRGRAESSPSQQEQILDSLLLYVVKPASLTMYIFMYYAYSKEILYNREVRLREFLTLLPVDLPVGFTGIFVTVIFVSLWFAYEHNHFCP
jgi:hypothetical protein